MNFLYVIIFVKIENVVESGLQLMCCTRHVGIEDNFVIFTSKMEDNFITSSHLTPLNHPIFVVLLDAITLFKYLKSQNYFFYFVCEMLKLLSTSRSCEF